jgi:DNA-directed RNA polymerase specialized sigma24 family protein
MPPLSDDQIRALIGSHPARGWRAFIDQYTPLMLGLLRRSGLVDRDEMMEVYVLVCEQLSARGFARLKSQDAGRGSIGGWLTVIVRHATIDWVRSRKGRRRLFQAVEALAPLDRRVFELYYWEERTPSEVAELLAPETGGRQDMATVLEALGRVDEVLTARHRAELLALAARSRTPVSLDETDAPYHVPDQAADPETAARIAQANAGLEAALRRLPAEDAAIVRLKYVEGLSNQAVEHALGITGLTVGRLQQILAGLRTLLLESGISGQDTAFGPHLSIERSST